jgi:hypothetical protein
MKFTAGVVVAGIDSMLLWGVFACGWHSLLGVLGIVLGICILFAMGCEFAEHWE